MGDTYSQLYVQTVFSVSNRAPLILDCWEDELYKYITGIIQQKGQKLLAINGMPDHIHIFLGMKPSCCLSGLVREIKKSSNHFIKRNGFIQTQFQWQEGFGAFSYGHSQLGSVISYIGNQKNHHKMKTFEEEYIEFLKRFEINFKERHLTV